MSNLVKKEIVKNNIKLTIYSYNKQDHIFKHITYHKNKPKFYENTLLEKIKSMNINGTYMDCGANIGNHSLYFLNFTKANKVISIEGHPLIFKILKLNIETNTKDTNKYLILNKLVGEQDCKDKYINLENANNCGVGQVNSAKKGFNIHMIKIDNLALNELSLIKLDVENYEYNVLLGAEKTIEKFHPIIIIELHKSNPHHNDILLFLQKYGYTTDGINYAKSPTYIYK